MKAALATVLDELVSDTPMSPGRQHKKLQLPGDFYSVRLSRHYRLVYVRPEDGLILPYAVGPHDEAYDI